MHTLICLSMHESKHTLLSTYSLLDTLFCLCVCVDRIMCMQQEEQHIEGIHTDMNAHTASVSLSRLFHSLKASDV